MALTARKCLEIEASISTYTFEGGVEHRCPWRPFAGVRLGFLRMTDSVVPFAAAMQKFNRSMVESMTVDRPYGKALRQLDHLTRT